MPCRPEIQKVPGSLPSFQSTSLAQTHEVCTRLHIPAPGAASAELIFLAEQQAESKLINHVQLIRLAFLCVSRECNGGTGEKTSVVQPALEKAVNMEFMQILLFILFLDTPASVPQCL